MKRVATLILALVLLCAGSALAAEPKVFRADGTPAVPMESNAVRNDYALIVDGDEVGITVFTSGLTIKDFTGTSIFVYRTEPTELTLDNVHLKSDVVPPRGQTPLWGYGDLTLTLRNDCTIEGAGSAISILDEEGTTNLTILGDGTLHGSEIGINLQGGDRSTANITLGGNVTVSGGRFAFWYTYDYESHNIYIDGANYPGISAEAGESSANAAELEGSPFNAKTDVYEQVNAVKYLRTQWTMPQENLDEEIVENIENIGNLPKTGDDSRLALWIMLMGMAGAAMFMLKKRAHN